MATAVRYLSESDAALQVLGAAYIQHQCYHSNHAKKQVRATHESLHSVTGTSVFIDLRSELHRV